MDVRSTPYLLECHGNSLDLTSPKVAGILNVTPDSFYDGGHYQAAEKALDRIGEMISDGADIIDIGGESTRPGADPVPVDEEISRVVPLVEAAVRAYPGIIFSVDTTKYDVAKAALDLGAHIINDVSGLQREPRLAELCSEYGAGYILMHSQGDPKTMQIRPRYEDVLEDIRTFFREQIARVKKSGDVPLILDPGIGFGKSLDHNLYIVANLDKFAEFGYPLMIGASRKSMIGQVLDERGSEGRLAGTLAVHYHSLMMGAKILRVHDVREASDSVKIYNALKVTR